MLLGAELWMGCTCAKASHLQRPVTGCRCACWDRFGLSGLAHVDGIRSNREHRHVSSRHWYGKLVMLFGSTDWVHDTRLIDYADETSKTEASMRQNNSDSTWSALVTTAQLQNTMPRRGMGVSKNQKVREDIRHSTITSIFFSWYSPIQASRP